MAAPTPVTITRQELLREPAPWPGAPFEAAVVALMVRKGLKFRPCFCPTPYDLLPPWRVEQDALQEQFTITQGDEV